MAAKYESSAFSKDFISEQTIISVSVYFFTQKMQVPSFLLEERWWENRVEQHHVNLRIICCIATAGLLLGVQLQLPHVGTTCTQQECFPLLCQIDFWSKNEPQWDKRSGFVLHGCYCHLCIKFTHIPETFLAPVSLYIYIYVKINIIKINKFGVIEHYLRLIRD